MSGRKVRQDIAGYNVAIRALEVEHTRALENTTRTPAVYKRVLDRVEALLEILRKERRDLMEKTRTEGYRAPSKRVVSKTRIREGAEHEA